MTAGTYDRRRQRRAFFAWERGPNGRASGVVYYDAEPNQKSPDRLFQVLAVAEIPDGTHNERFFPGVDETPFFHALEQEYPL